MNLNEQTNVMIEKKKRKLHAEMHGLDHCREDLSDVDFLAGGKNASLPVLSGSLGIASFITLRLWLRRSVTGHGGGFGVIFILLLLMALLCLYMWFRQSGGGKIRVNGKSLSYNGNLYSADEINLVKCDWLGNVCVYSGGKKVASVSWEEENAELIIAWSRKCGIHTDCDHTALNNRLSKM